MHAWSTNRSIHPVQPIDRVPKDGPAFVRPVVTRARSTSRVTMVVMLTSVVPHLHPRTAHFERTIVTPSHSLFDVATAPVMVTAARRTAMHGGNADLPLLHCANALTTTHCVHHRAPPNSRTLNRSHESPGTIKCTAHRSCTPQDNHAILRPTALPQTREVHTRDGLRHVAKPAGLAGTNAGDSAGVALTSPFVSQSCHNRTLHSGAAHPCALARQPAEGERSRSVRSPLESSRTERQRKGLRQATQENGLRGQALCISAFKPAQAFIRSSNKRHANTTPPKLV
jgi:hypothetical protein